MDHLLDPLVETKAIKNKLSAPPLARVLGAATFSTILKIGDSSGAHVADFQERMRGRYPELQMQTEDEFTLELKADGTFAEPQLRKKVIWRMLDNERGWRVSLTTDSIALEAQRNYSGRDDFVRRFIELCTAVEEMFAPSQLKRVGVRYLNVLNADRLERLGEFVRPELTSFGCMPFKTHLDHSISVSKFRVPEGDLILKHGIVAPGMPHEFMVTSSDERRWYFDVDASVSMSEQFTSGVVEKHANALTKRTGTLFNWAMQPEFMATYNVK